MMDLDTDSCASGRVTEAHLAAVDFLQHPFPTAVEACLFEAADWPCRVVDRLHCSVGAELRLVIPAAAIAD
jgi:hypothetical protein